MGPTGAAAPADVTVCIPAYEAAPFIARTLAHAQRQTHERLRILVSVDRSSDTTVDICTEIARDDDRIDVIAQPERLGWSRNANALLDRVDTPYFFFYFHDDVIDADYVEVLLDALRRDPDAASAHADMEQFGDKSRTIVGEDYAGDATSRIVRALIDHRRGMLLRSLMRTSSTGHLRFADLPGRGKWRVLPYTLALLAAGPSRHVPGVRYHRWIRTGSLTKVWHPTSVAELVEGQQASVAQCLAVIDRAAHGDDDARALMTYVLRAHVMTTVRQDERRLAPVASIDPIRISPAFDIPSPPPLRGLPADLVAAVTAATSR